MLPQEPDQRLDRKIQMPKGHRFQGAGPGSSSAGPRGFAIINFKWKQNMFKAPNEEMWQACNKCAEAGRAAERQNIGTAVHLELLKYECRPSTFVGIQLTANCDTLTQYRWNQSPSSVLKRHMLYE